MLKFQKLSNAKTGRSRESKDIIQAVSQRIREHLDTTSCHVAMNDDGTAITIKWLPARLSSDTEYSEESIESLLKKFGDIGKAWESSIMLEHKDATQAYLVLTTEIQLGSLLQDIKKTSKDADADNTMESVVEAWLLSTVDTLDPSGVTSAITGILEKDGFIQEVDDSLTEQECDV